VAKTLFLLTKTYPYGADELYITNELEYISPFFEKIYLYPNDHYNFNEQHTKSLPANVQVIDLNKELAGQKRKSLKDYLYILKAISGEFIKSDTKNVFLKNFRENLLNFKIQLALSNIFYKYLVQSKTDISNSVFYSYWFHKSAILLSILKDRKKIHSYIARAHSVDLYHEKWGLLSNEVKIPPFKFFKLRHIDRLFSISTHGKDFLTLNYPQYADKISVSLLGVKPGVKEENRKQGSFQVITCSRMDHNKRVHLLAKALCSVKYPVKWTHFGSGRFLDEVNSLIKQMPSYVSVDIRGKSPNKDVIDFYSENPVNLFVNLSLVEGLPVSIMEAMAFGVPILATSVYGTPEAVTDGKNGFLLKKDFSMEELIDKLNYCIENEKALKKMGEESFLMYSEKFNAEKNYKAFAGIISK
jgi:colanic acid/amylovoran biosynthesis glycosyltransferase